MCSIKIVLENAHGQQQTFTRSLEAAGDISAAACLRDLRSLVGEVQTELNAALTRQVDDQRSAEKGKGKHPAATGQSSGTEDEESDDSEDSKEEKTNGNGGGRGMLGK
ncbi:uncharacterized protein LOC112569935 isoform X2 [Pomacea canaliculata]|uniref:uncharacterized protein LOC112569935 isoform X2 n=1 Tax=Pomacea canaliculata TaxID=400727 RepID=UPI000D7391CD|nr:uncharacterized protein LOC112569935 isoform X2 [Pomacea canaliculata]